MNNYITKNFKEVRLSEINSIIRSSNRNITILLVVAKTKTTENKDLRPENADLFMTLIQEVKNSMFYSMKNSQKLRNFSARNVTIHYLNDYIKH